MGVKVPAAGAAPVLGLAVAAVVVAALAATALVLQRAAPITPPVSMEAAIAPAAMAILTLFIGFLCLLAVSIRGRGLEMDARARIRLEAAAHGAL